MKTFYFSLYTFPTTALLQNIIEGSFQESTIRLGQLLVVISLKGKPAFLVRADLGVTKLGLVITDEPFGVAGSRAGGVGQELGVAGLVEADEPEGGGVDGLGAREQAVVLEDDGFPVAQGGGDAFALLAVQDDAAEVVVDGVRLVEAQGVLRHHVEFAAEHAEGLAVHGMRVARCVDVGPGFVDLRVDGEGGGVDLLRS